MKRANKYGNKRVTIDGIPFHSMAEGARYQELKLMQKCGEISELLLQVPFVLFKKSKHGGKVVYKADFVYKDKSGELVVEDVKGYRTRDYILKKRILAELYDIKIKEV